jgi:hypothetical protein
MTISLHILERVGVLAHCIDALGGVTRRSD